MLFKLFLLFTILPILELALLIKVGTVFGSLNTIGVVILTGIVGSLVARYQGISVVRKIAFELNQGRFPADELFNGLFVFGGGLLLLTPGFLTDLLGILFFVPATREIAKGVLYRYISKVLQQDGSFHIKYVGSSF